jgi:hypothetical protein
VRVGIDIGGTFTDGTVQTLLDEVDVSDAIAFLQSERVTSVAVCLLNAYVNPAYERRIGDLLRSAGDWTVTLSCDVLIIIERNVRVPRNALGDLRAQLAACHICEQACHRMAPMVNSMLLARHLTPFDVSTFAP